MTRDDMGSVGITGMTRDDKGLLGMFRDVWEDWDTRDD